MAILPKTQLRHLGVYAFDPERLAAFYSRWFALAVSDVGIGSTGHKVFFMTGSPNEHHQVVFASGRQQGTPGMNQISFLVGSLEDLKQLALAFHEAGVPILQQKDHGNSWSLYVEDPEGNRIELYTPSDWHVPQPIWWPLDLLTESVETIRERTERSARATPGHTTRQAWMADIQSRIDALRQAQ